MSVELIQPGSGKLLVVADEHADRWRAAGYRDAPAAPATAQPSTDSVYGSWKVAELHAEIERRNEGRDDADRIPNSGKKAELVAALTDDDATDGS